MNFDVQPPDLQFILVALIAVQWWTLSQYVHQQRFFRYWALGWGWLAVLIALARLAAPFSGSDSNPLLMRTGMVLAGLMQLYYFTLGAWALGEKRDIARFRPGIGIAVVVAAAVVLGFLAWSATDDTARGIAIRNLPRNLGLAVVFSYSGWVLFQQRTNERFGAYLITSGCLAGLGGHLGYYAAGDINTFVQWATGTAILPYDSTALMDGRNFLIDLVLDAGIGIGTLLLLAEEGRRSMLTLRGREAEFRGIFNEAPTPIALIDGTGVIRKANRALGDLLEVPEIRLVGRPLNDYIEADNIDLSAPFSNNPGSSHPRRHEVALRAGSGRRITAFIHLSRLQEPDAGARFVAQILDMTEHRNLQERLSHLAMHDNVSGLPNRAYFEEQFYATVKRMQRRKTPMALMFLDLNDFKSVNDNLGHEAGDHVLQSIAQRIASSVREGDFVARFGGDEFTVLLEECLHADEARTVAGRIVNAVARPVRFRGSEIRPTVSIGVVLSSVTDEAEVLLRNADMAMYRAKKQTGNPVELVDRSGSNLLELHSGVAS